MERILSWFTFSMDFLTLTANQIKLQQRSYLSCGTQYKLDWPHALFLKTLLFGVFCPEGHCYCREIVLILPVYSEHFIVDL